MLKIVPATHIYQNVESDSETFLEITTDLKTEIFSFQLLVNEPLDTLSNNSPRRNHIHSLRTSDL